MFCWTFRPKEIVSNKYAFILVSARLQQCVWYGSSRVSLVELSQGFDQTGGQHLYLDQTKWPFIFELYIDGHKKIPRFT